MAGVITTGAHPKALWPGVHAWIMGKYNDNPKRYTDAFDVRSSKMAYEELVEESGFGLAMVKAQGASGSYDEHQQGGTVRFTHVAYSLGFIVTYEELKDNLYAGKAFYRGAKLAKSFMTTKEVVAANVLNRAFNSSYTGIDGKELLATDHPSIGGTWQNELTTAADLSEASLEDMLTLISLAKDSRGLPIAIRGKKMIVHPSNHFNAERILKSTLQNDTANNAVNAIKSSGLLREGFAVNEYLADSDAWFVTTDAPDGLIMFEREGFSVSKDNDFDTKNAKTLGYERYSVGWGDPRGLFGSPGA